MLLQHYSMEIRHIKGNTNIADFLSRYGYSNDSPDDVINPPETEIRPEVKTSVPLHPLDDVDIYGYITPINNDINTIDVESYVADYKNTSQHDFTPQRKRKYTLCQFLPPNVSASTDLQHINVLSKRQTQRQQGTTKHNKITNGTNIIQSNDTALHNHSSDLDTDLQTATQQIRHNTDDLINSQSQSDDAFFGAMIDYIQNKTLPSDPQLAQIVLWQTDDYFICNQQLWHLSRPSKRRKASLLPRY